MRHQIEVALLEFEEHGNTIWVQDSNGSTVLRIKCTGFEIEKSCVNVCAHADVMVDRKIHFCIPKTGESCQEKESDEGEKVAYILPLGRSKDAQWE